MAIRKYKPTTPGRRASSVSDFQEITRSTPEKSLLRPLHKTGGRNVHGHITARHIGGGHKLGTCAWLQLNSVDGRTSRNIAQR